MRALCLQCGSGKYGALTACRRCGHHPQERDDEARHLHVGEDLDDTRRAEIARAIEEGRPYTLDETVVAALAAELETIGAVPVWVYVAVTSLVGLGVGAVLFVGWVVLVAVL